MSAAHCAHERGSLHPCEEKIHPERLTLPPAGGSVSMASPAIPAAAPRTQNSSRRRRHLFRFLGAPKRAPAFFSSGTLFELFRFLPRERVSLWKGDTFSFGARLRFFFHSFFRLFSTQRSVTWRRELRRNGKEGDVDVSEACFHAHSCTQAWVHSSIGSGDNSLFAHSLEERASGGTLGSRQ